MHLFWKKRKPLGTMGGNESVVDAVEGRGPQYSEWTGGPNYGLYNAERAAGVEADLDTDMNSDFDRLGDAEDHMYDALEKPED